MRTNNDNFMVTFWNECLSRRVQTDEQQQVNLGRIAELILYHLQVQKLVNHSIKSITLLE